MLDRMVGLKDKFAAVMEVFKKSGNDPKALEAMLNSPDMVPLFRDLMGVTETTPPALPRHGPRRLLPAARRDSRSQGKARSRGQSSPRTSCSRFSIENKSSADG